MALPGLRGTEHIGFTVPDLDEADDFFVDVIGCERVYSLGPFEHAEGDWMLEHLNVHPRTVMRELTFYRCEFGPNFEVFQFEPADGQRPQPRNSDLGGHHLAFYVDDMDAAVAYLREQGRARPRRADREPERERRPALGVLPHALGHAVRAGELPGRQGLRGGRRP